MLMRRRPRVVRLEGAASVARVLASGLLPGGGGDPLRPELRSDLVRGLEVLGLGGVVLREGRDGQNVVGGAAHVEPARVELALHLEAAREAGRLFALEHDQQVEEGLIVVDDLADLVALAGRNVPLVVEPEGGGHPIPHPAVLALVAVDCHLQRLIDRREVLRHDLQFDGVLQDGIHRAFFLIQYAVDADLSMFDSRLGRRVKAHGNRDKEQDAHKRA